MRLEQESPYTRSKTEVSVLSSSIVSKDYFGPRPTSGAHDTAAPSMVDDMRALRYCSIGAENNGVHIAC